MLGDINKDMQVQKYEIVLCKPNHEMTAVLKEAYEIEYSPQFPTTDELRFTLPYYLHDGNINKHFDMVKEDYTISLNDEKMFVISEVEESEDDGRITKTVSCYSLEYELNKKMLRGYNLKSRQLYSVTNEYDSDGYQRGVFNYLTTLTSWGIDEQSFISSGLLSKYRAFDISKKSIFDFIVNDIQKSFGCLFLFDTKTKTISVTSIEDFGQNRGLYISNKNYIKSLQKKIDVDEIVTRLYCYGNEEISINSVNPSGMPYLEDFSYFKNTNYMSQDLIDALDSYKALLDYHEANSTFQGYMDELSSIQQSISVKNAELDNLKAELDIINDDIDNAIQLGNPLTTLNSQKKAKESEILAKESEIEGLYSQMETLKGSVNSFRELVKKENNFTTSQLVEIDTFVKEGEWSDSSYETVEDLYEKAKEKMASLSSPKIQIDIDIVDFLQIVECQRDWGKLVLGDIVNIESEKLGIFVEMRLVGYTHNEDDKSLTLKFSSTNSIEDPFIFQADLIKNAVTSSTKVDMSKYKWDKSKDNESKIDELINQNLDTSRNKVVAGKNQSQIIDERGIWLRKVSDEGVVSPEQVRLINNIIALSKDGFDTATTAITPDGINAQVLYGKTIIGADGIFEGIDIVDGINKLVEIGKYTKNDIEKLGIRINGGCLEITNGLPANQIEQDATGRWDKAGSDASQALVDIGLLGDDVDVINQQVTNLQGDIASYSDDGKISLAEAKSLELSLEQIKSASNDLIVIGTDLGIIGYGEYAYGDEEAALAVNVAVDDYLLSIQTLETALSPFVNQLEYPVGITLAQRESLKILFADVQTKHSVIINEIFKVRSDENKNYTDEQSAYIQADIESVQSDVNDFASDGKITNIEANSLKISWGMIKSESLNIIDKAATLDIVEEKESYIGALSTLEVEMGKWIGQDSYPVAITLSQRMTLSGYLEDVQNAKTALLNAISDATGQKAVDESNSYTDAALQNYVETSRYISDINAIQEQIDGNITAWFGSSAPTLSNYPAVEWTTDLMKDAHIGDTFTDTATGYSYRFLDDGGYKWIQIQDSDITQALSLAQKAQDTADGKRRVFVTQPTPPYDVGDLWAEGENTDLMVCQTPKASGGSYSAQDWRKASKYTDDSALNSFVDIQYANDMSSIQASVDGKITSWFQETVPSWEFSENEIHDGDLWYKESANELKRYSSSSDSWSLITDKKAIEAYSLASTAKATADGKITTYYQVSAPTSGMSDGDLWIDTDDKNKMYIYESNSWTLCRDEDIAVALTKASESIEKLSDIASDSKVTPVEKAIVATEWGNIQAEKLSLESQADSQGVDKISYINAYNALSTYITPILAVQSETTDITRSVFNSKFLTYYDEKVKLVNACTNAVNSNLENFANSVSVKVDSKITSYFQEVDPNVWLESERESHNGDIWYKDSTKELRRYSHDTNTWILIEDKTALDAYSIANQAQDTADGKRRVFYSTPTVPYDMGDLWSQGAQGDLMICTNAKTSGGVYSESDWKKSSKYTDDTMANIANQNAQQAQTDATNSLSILSDISNDGKVTESEKIQIHKEITTIQTEKTKLTSQAVKYAIDSTAYVSAYDALNNYILPILSYAGTSNVVRDTFDSNFANYYSEKVALLNAVSDKINDDAQASIDSLNDSVTTINQQVSVLQSDIDEYSSDNMLTLAELNSLNTQLKQIESESNDLLAKAEDLGIIGYGQFGYGDSETQLDINVVSSNYLNSISVIQGYITGFLGSAKYPVEITVQQREGLLLAFENVQLYKSQLVNEITKVQSDENKNYTDEQNSYANADIDKIQSDVDDFASDGKITRIESNALNLSLVQVNRESENIIASANSLGITAEKGDYIDSLSALNAEMLKWVCLPYYPVNITNVQRDTINTRFENVQVAKSILNNKIAQVREQNATDVANDAQDAADEAKADAIDALGKLSDISSDGVLTPSEKIILQKEWSIICSEKILIENQADFYRVDKSGYTAVFNVLDAYIPVFLEDSQVNSNVDRNVFNSNFENYYAEKIKLINAVNNEIKRVADEAKDKADSSIQQDAAYNGVVINAENGLEVTRSDNKAKTVLNATDGLKIQSSVDGEIWTDELYADTNGNLNFTGKLVGAEGEFSGTLISSEFIGGVVRDENSKSVFDLANGRFRLGNSDVDYKLKFDGTNLFLGDGTLQWNNLDEAAKINLKGETGDPGQDGLSVEWQGVSVEPPANPEQNWTYANINDGIVYIYNNGAWEVMTRDGNDGVDGTNGDDGLSVFITYHDNPVTSTPPTPTGYGTTNGWHTNPTAASNWMSQKISDSVYNGAWGSPIQISGRDGVDGADGADGAPGTPGSYYAPSYLHSTYISSTTIQSPIITGNTAKVRDTIYVGQYDTTSNKAGICALGTSDSSVRFWAGSATKTSAPFRVTQGGSVYMTKANIQTESVNSTYINMSGSKIQGGKVTYGSSYTIGTADFSNASRGGIIQLDGYYSSTSTTCTRRMYIGNNTVAAQKGNLVFGGYNEYRTVVVSRKADYAHVSNDYGDSALHVVGEITADKITTSGTIEASNYIISDSFVFADRFAIFNSGGIKYGVISDTFTSADGKTITVTGGIITSVS